MPNSEQLITGYIPELDGIRGISIAVVMIYHAGIPFFPGGFIGVDVFFVLSGYLITTILMRQYDKAHKIDFKRFYINRVLRLAPALIILLSISTVICWMFLEWKYTKYHIEDSIISLLYMSNWARALNIHPPYFLGHTWSLSIEEQFYIIWPPMLYVFLRFIKSKKHIVIFVAFLCMVTCIYRIWLTHKGYSPIRMSNGLDTRADALLLGCLIGIYMSDRELQRKYTDYIVPQLRWMACGSLAAIFAVCIVMSFEDAAMYYWCYMAVEVFAAILIMYAVSSKDGLLKRILQNRALVFTGSISYGLYLYHYPIFRALLLLKFDPEYICIVGSFIVYILAFMSYRFCEMPCLKLKAKLNTNTIIPAIKQMDQVA